MRLREFTNPDHLPALDPRYEIERPALDLGPLDHPPRILLLYGSLRPRSFSRFATEEAARLLRFFGAEPRIFDPSDMPFPDQVKGTITRPFMTYASCRYGRKARSGAARNGTARLPG